MTDPDMAYWNNLPFVGWHNPSFLRISDGKSKSPDNGSIGPSDEEREAKKEALALKHYESRLIREATKELERQAKAVERRRLAALDDARRKEMEARRHQLKQAEWAKKQREASDRRAERESLQKERHEEAARTFKRTEEERAKHRVAASKSRAKNGYNVGNGLSKTILTDQNGKEWEFRSVSDAARYLCRSTASIRGANQRGTLCNGHRVKIEAGGKVRSKVARQ